MYPFAEDHMTENVVFRCIKKENNVWSVNIVSAGLQILFARRQMQWMYIILKTPLLKRNMFDLSRVSDLL